MRSSRRTDRAARAAIAAALLGLVGIGAGCTAAQREAHAYRMREMKISTAKKAVSERAHDYWLAVRWRDWEKAAGFLEQEPDRVAYLEGRADDRSTEAATMDQVEVKLVVLDEDLERAEIRVAFIEVASPDFRTTPRERKQLWYKRYGQWWVVPTQVLDPDAPAAAPSSATR